MSSPVLIWRRSFVKASPSPPTSPAQRIKHDRAARSAGEDTPEDAEWVKEYMVGHDNVMATNLEQKFNSEQAQERHEQLMKDAVIARAAEEEREKEEAALKDQMEKDQGLALKYQSSQDEIMAKSMHAKVMKEEAAREASIKKDEALAQAAEEERLLEEKKLETQTKKDEELALKYQEAQDSFIAKQMAEKLQKEFEEESAAQIKADEAMALCAEKERLEKEKEMEARIKADEDAARKLHAAPTPPPKSVPHAPVMEKTEGKEDVSKWGSEVIGDLPSPPKFNKVAPKEEDVSKWGSEAIKSPPKFNKKVNLSKEVNEDVSKWGSEVVNALPTPPKFIQADPKKKDVAKWGSDIIDANNDTGAGVFTPTKDVNKWGSELIPEVYPEVKTTTVSEVA